MSKEKTNVIVSMVSDFICPWCWIGEKRLKDAIDNLPGDVSVSIEHKPFELNPDMPTEGMDRKTYRSLKFGSWARSKQLDAGTVAAGEEDGVVFNYDAMKRTPNTFLAHKLTHWAAEHGRAGDVSHRTLKAYFVEGRDIGDPETLADIAGEAGLDSNAARTYLADATTDEGVRHALSETRTGVGGVPQFDINGQIVSGAQSAETLTRVILGAAADAKRLVVAGD